MIRPIVQFRVHLFLFLSARCRIKHVNKTINTPGPIRYSHVKKCQKYEIFQLLRDIKLHHKMPLQREHLQFAFIFLAVPIQYFIVQQSGSSESTRTHQISALINQVKETYNRWFKVDSWLKWLKSVLESKYETF